MAGLLMRELIARGDLQRCLVVCPGSLAEQWQDELYRRFHLPFEILTNDRLETARTGNWFLEADLVIARLDKLSRDEAVQEKLAAPDCRWDLVVCDEAHKMSASFYGGDVKYTKRFLLGRLLSRLTRHFLLMTATPHNGKDSDFQLFMSLLDEDRFEGKYRKEHHTTQVGDLMRRMVKEELLTFEGKPLFPERVARTVPYRLSQGEAFLYAEVTNYVREEFNRAEALENDRRAGTVGFALTILQRRLASSPEAIYQSLRRRRERLEERLRELEELQRERREFFSFTGPSLDAEDLEDLEDAPDSEVDAVEEEVLDQATAARSSAELRAEIATLAHLEELAATVRRSGEDTKWRELAGLLNSIFSDPRPSSKKKIVIFTEHRDTLNYLKNRISTLLGRDDALVIIHGGMKREERLAAQESFKFQPEVQVLLATDAAGEGINLQRANLMVNYDLPWNPNRLEQRFGRIHRIGQTEVCFLWNLVAMETREGDVYRRLLDKLDEARSALGGQVFDVLGKLVFEGESLRNLLIKAIRYGELPEVRERLNRAVEEALDRRHIQELLEDRALVHDAMDISRVRRIREDMERADARRLQPHFIQSFFAGAFARLGGTMLRKEEGRFEIRHVPQLIRNRNRLSGLRDPILSRYERVTFEKEKIAPPGEPMAAFLCPGSPLMEAVLDITLERNRELLKRGAVLVDEADGGTQPRVYFSLEHTITDGSATPPGARRVVSQRVLHIEMRPGGQMRHVRYAPYLDYRPLLPGEPGAEEILSLPQCGWIGRDLEDRVLAFGVTDVAPEHLEEVKRERLEQIARTRQAVNERLLKEMNRLDSMAEKFREQEKEGRPNARLNFLEARKKADLLSSRRDRRLEELAREAQISALPPLVLGGFLVVPAGLLGRMGGGEEPADPGRTRDTQAAAARAREIIMDVEKGLGFEPVDREMEKLGYDIESRVPGTGKLRFIEVKGRISGASTITVTRNEILYSLNKPEDFILAIVEFLDGGEHRVHYVRRPFQREPDFGVTSANYSFAELIARAEPPD